MSDDRSNGPAPAEELRNFIERWERLDEEKKAIAADQKDVLGEAKSRGYDVKAIREIIKLRKLSIEERRDREAAVDTYKAALGMLDGTPLGKWAVDRLTKPKPAADGAPPATIRDTERFRTAVTLVTQSRKASVSWLQRQLGVGYNEAARLIELMEQDGIVSRPDHVGQREVLAPPPADDPEAPSGEAADQPYDADRADDGQPDAAEPTLADAHRLGGEAARAGQPVTANPFPAFDERRAAWDESWCAELGSDGMEIPEALRPTSKPKKADKPAADEPEQGE